MEAASKTRLSAIDVSDCERARGSPVEFLYVDGTRRSVDELHLLVAWGTEVAVERAHSRNPSVRDEWGATECPSLERAEAAGAASTAD